MRLIPPTQITTRRTGTGRREGDGKGHALVWRKRRGKVNPLTENAAPVTLACEIVTDVPPVFVNVSDRLRYCRPERYRKKDSSDSQPTFLVSLRFPRVGMLRLEFAPVEVMLTLPLAAPLAVGLKSTVNDVLWPAANVMARPVRSD